MLTDEANQLKKQKREDQLRGWREREQQFQQEQEAILTNNTINNGNTMKRMRSPKVRFPQACAFLAACSSNDIDDVKHYLKMNVNINTTNVDGLTALHQACIDNKIDMVKFLVENGADLNVQDNEGWTPLHAAVSDGNLNIAKCLISKGAKLNICNNEGDLPIDLCDINVSNNKNDSQTYAKYENIRKYIDDEMKKQEIDIDFEKKREELIMYEDAKENNFHNKIHPKTGATPLHVSAAKGYTRVMRLLIQGGSNVHAIDNDGWTALHAAAHWDEEEACRMLIENGASCDLKTFSGQSVFDVCDDDMIEKLKQIQAKCKLNRTSIDLVPIKQPASTSQRKLSDEFKSPSTTATTTTVLNQRRQITSGVSNTINSESLDDKNSTNSSINQSNVGNNNNNLMDSLLNQHQLSSPSLDSHTNQKINQVTNAINSKKDDSLNDRQLNSMTSTSTTSPSLHSLNNQRVAFDKRWGTHTSANDVPYKRRLAPTTSLPLNKANEKNSSYTNDSTTNTQSNDTSDTNNMVTPDIRRYSLAPIASKDEQAELIRKQKAKLERHYRRSTQAVSYEDIKSAEATIKATLNNTNTNLNDSQDTSINNSNTTLASPSTPPLPTPPPPLPNNPPPQLPTTTTITTTLSSSLVTSPPTNDISSTAHSSPLSPTFASTSSDQNSNEKDTIIAKDIETDKLLNAIEKSKGFSDAYSTSSRRLRNRSQAFGTNQTSLYDQKFNNANDSSALSTSASTIGKKINKLIWNEDKLEVEYRDLKSDDNTIESSMINNQQHSIKNVSSSSGGGGGGGGGSSASTDSSGANSELNNFTMVKRQYSAPDTRQISSSSLNGIQFNQQQQTTTSNSNSGVSTTSSNGHSSRLRLANENASTSGYTSRANVKRSVSQVPTSTSERYHSAATSSTRITSPNVINQSSSTSISNNEDSNNNNKPNDRIMIELIKQENEQLKSHVKRLQKELDEMKRASINSINQSTSINNDSYMDKREKRANERRISELEEEVRKMESIKQDNVRLKEENAALIRVISKLSK